MSTSISSAEMLNARQYGRPVLSELPRALPGARAGLEDDGNAAFLSRRRSLARSGSRNPIERVAAFLVAISQNNRYEGRDPHTIPELVDLRLCCGSARDRRARVGGFAHHARTEGIGRSEQVGRPDPHELPRSRKTRRRALTGRLMARTMSSRLKFSAHPTSSLT